MASGGRRAGSPRSGRRAGARARDRGRSCRSRPGGRRPAPGRLAGAQAHGGLVRLGLEHRQLDVGVAFVEHATARGADVARRSGRRPGAAGRRATRPAPPAPPRRTRSGPGSPRCGRRARARRRSGEHRGSRARRAARRSRVPGRRHAADGGLGEVEHLGRGRERAPSRDLARTFIRRTSSISQLIAGGSSLHWTDGRFCDAARCRGARGSCSDCCPRSGALRTASGQGRARGRRVARGDRLRAHRTRRARAAAAGRSRHALAGLRANVAAIGVLAVVQVAGPLLLIAVGEQEISSSMTGILVATAPIFTFLLAFALEGEERASGLSLVGVVIGIAGVALLLGVDAGGGAAALVGGLLVVTASFGYGVGAWFVKRRVRGVEPVAMVGATAATASVLMAPVAALDLPAAAPDLAATGRDAGARRAVHRGGLRDLLLAGGERRPGPCVAGRLHRARLQHRLRRHAARRELHHRHGRRSGPDRGRLLAGGRGPPPRAAALTRGRRAGRRRRRCRGRG